MHTQKYLKRLSHGAASGQILLTKHMPDVGLLSSSEPLTWKNRVVLKLSVEVDGLPVYTETYDVDKVRKELLANREETLKRWNWRLQGVAYCRDKQGFSACLTRTFVDGQGCACGHAGCRSLDSREQSSSRRPKSKNK